MKNLLLIILFLIFTSNAYATLTPGNVPVTKTGGSSPVVQNSDITDTGGNVGIGVSTPTVKLDVSGAINATSITLGTGTGAFTASNGFTMDPTGSGVTFSILSNGNVGIGSPNPSQALDVLGTIKGSSFSGVTGESLTLSDSTTNNVSTSKHGFAPKLDNDVTHFLNGQGGYTTPTAGVPTAQGGANAVQYNNGSAQAGTENIFSFNGTNIGINTTNANSASLTVVKTGTNTPFAVNSAAGTGGDYMKIDSNGNVGIGTTSSSMRLAVVAGNVGIGTWKGVTTPLEVHQFSSGGLVTNLLIANDSTSTGAAAAIRFATSASFNSSGNGSFDLITTRQSDGSNNVDFQLSPGAAGAPVKKFTFAGTNGNLGLGTTVPQAKINVSSATGIGWSVKTGANTACNTTCPSTSACVFGFDTGLGGSDIVACTDATADTCVCAGP